MDLLSHNSRISDIRHRDKHLKRILLIHFPDSPLDFVLDLLLSLLPVTGESKLLLVTPQHVRPSTRPGLREEVVQTDDLIPSMVTDDSEEGSLIVGDTQTDQVRDPLVELFADHFAVALVVSVARDTLYMAKLDENTARLMEQRHRAVSSLTSLLREVFTFALLLLPNFKRSADTD